MFAWFRKGSAASVDYATITNAGGRRCVESVPEEIFAHALSALSLADVGAAACASRVLRAAAPRAHSVLLARVYADRNLPPPPQRSQHEERRRHSEERTRDDRQNESRLGCG